MSAARRVRFGPAFTLPVKGRLGRPKKSSIPSASAFLRSVVQPPVRARQIKPSDAEAAPNHSYRPNMLPLSLLLPDDLAADRECFSARVSIDERSVRRVSDSKKIRGPAF